jgi:glycosyltransferase involved in cell wall biosynthesis
LLWSPGNCGPLLWAEQVLTIHDISFLDHPEWYSRSFCSVYGALVPRLARRVKHILTVSEFTRERIIEMLRVDRQRVTVTYPGIDPAFIAPREDEVVRTLARLGVAQPYVFALGAASPRKNLARLYEAWARLGSTVGEVMLVVAGAQRSSFAARGSATARNSSVLTLGEVQDADLPALYAGAMVFVYPSLYEGFGLPPLEAMSCGTPVITSNTTALPESTGDAALSVDPYDATAMADAMQRVITDLPLRAKLRQKGLDRAKSFTWDRTAQQTWQVLENCSGISSGRKC